MTGDGRRPKRVAEALRMHLAQILSREFSDPLLASLVITDVEVPDDLSSALISVRVLAGDDDPAQRKTLLRALGKVTGRLRHAVAPRLRLRRTPELRFRYDTGHDAARRVEELLAEIAREGTAQEDQHEPSAPDAHEASPELLEEGAVPERRDG